MKFPFLFKNNKADKKKETFYPVCPSCISPHLEFVREYTSGWLTTPRYYCSNCGYAGIIVLEVDVTLFETKTPQEIKQLFLEEEQNDLEKEE